MRKIRTLFILSICLLLSVNISCETNEGDRTPEIPEIPETPGNTDDPDDEDKENPVAPQDKELKVLQLNIWHGTTTVPNGFGGLVNLILQLDPDIVFLCELRNEAGNSFTNRLANTLIGEGKSYYGENLDMSVGILSKYKIETPTPLKNPGSMIKASVNVNGQTVVLYSAHLDYTHYECYLPRGYSGTTWKKLDAPVTDVNYILEANRLATRDEAIAAFLVDAKAETDKGNLVIMGGDFNEPSHLDWQDNTKNLWDHNGVVINWDCSVMLTEAGYKDAYREIYPDPVKYPGFTFPAANKYVDVSKLAWAPDVDERDRIDFIYYYHSPNIKLNNCQIVGPSGSVYYGKMREHDAQDILIEPRGIWPTDHKGNLATFKIKNAK